ncbi:hypothetical protein EJD97_008835 [Solanum chilense]|uniref:Uncharacterized protein n=1 Tax=Solanum chilense TaxID=4083 RepID=A0A6N2BL18_SOLCI|nr:hypothetical protein EJD97_008835 [Solanum chilense]
MELAGATTIKKDRVVDELVIFGGVGAGAGQDQGTTSCRRIDFLYEKCKKKYENSIMYLQTLSQAVNEFKNKRGNEEEKKSFSKAIQNLKKKMFGELPMATIEEVKEYKELSDEATTVGGRSLKQFVDEFEGDEDMINYVRGISPYPEGMDWIGAKRILTVMNLNKNHFVILKYYCTRSHEC